MAMTSNEDIGHVCCQEDFPAASRKSFYERPLVQVFRLECNIFSSPDERVCFLRCPLTYFDCLSLNLARPLSTAPVFRHAQPIAWKPRGGLYSTSPAASRKHILKKIISNRH